MKKLMVIAVLAVVVFVVPSYADEGATIPLDNENLHQSQGQTADQLDANQQMVQDAVDFNQQCADAGAEWARELAADIHVDNDNDVVSTIGPETATPTGSADVNAWAIALETDEFADNPQANNRAGDVENVWWMWIDENGNKQYGAPPYPGSENFWGGRQYGLLRLVGAPGAKTLLKFAFNTDAAGKADTNSLVLVSGSYGCEGDGIKKLVEALGNFGDTAMDLLDALQNVEILTVVHIGDSEDLSVLVKVNGVQIWLTLRK